MIYGYIRVSTDKQTLENQRHIVLNYCEVNGLHIDGWIEETISGTKAPDKRKLASFSAMSSRETPSSVPRFPALAAERRWGTWSIWTRNTFACFTPLRRSLKSWTG